MQIVVWVSSYYNISFFYYFIIPEKEIITNHIFHLWIKLWISQFVDREYIKKIKMKKVLNKNWNFYLTYKENPNIIWDTRDFA